MNPLPHLTDHYNRKERLVLDLVTRMTGLIHFEDFTPLTMLSGTEREVLNTLVKDGLVMEHNDQYRATAAGMTLAHPTMSAELISDYVRADMDNGRRIAGHENQ